MTSFDWAVESRKALIQEMGSMERGLCEERLHNLLFYLNTIEGLIKEREDADIEVIARHSESQVDWSKYHPWQWQGIIGTQFRQSFIITLMSVAESHLELASLSVKTVSRTSAKSRGRGWVARSRSLLDEVPEFRSPTSLAWDRLQGLNLVRNICVHQQGFSDEVKRTEIHDLLGDPPGIRHDEDFYEIKTPFCKFAHESIVDFFAQLYDHFQQMCVRLSNDI